MKAFLNRAFFLMRFSLFTHIQSDCERCIACNYHAVKTQIKVGARDFPAGSPALHTHAEQRDINLILSLDTKNRENISGVQLRELSKWLRAPIKRSRARCVNIYAQRDGIMMSGTKL
jgi:hypothetical protein